MSDSFDPYYTWLGIPPQDQPPHFYRLLAIEPFETNVQAIEHAADRQMSHLKKLNVSQHAAAAERLLNELARARVTLLNPEKKAAYDRQLRAKDSGNASTAKEDAASSRNSKLGMKQATRTQGPRPLMRATPLSETGEKKPVAPSTSSRPVVTNQRPHLLARIPFWAYISSLGAITIIVLVLEFVFFGSKETSPTLGDTASNGPGTLAQVNTAGQKDPSSPTSAPPEKDASKSEQSATDRTRPAPAGSPPAGDQNKTASAGPSRSPPPRFDRPDGRPPGNLPSLPRDPATNLPWRGGTAPVRSPNTLAGTPPVTESPLSPPTLESIFPSRQRPSRHAVPTDEQRQAAEQVVRELYAKELVAAKRAPEKAALAAKMLELSKATTNDWPGRFALSRMARDLAVEGLDPKLAVDVLEDQAAAFDVPEWNGLVELLEKLSAAPQPSVQKPLVEAGLRIADRAAADDEFDAAVRSARIALEAAKRMHEAKLITQVTERGKDLVLLQAYFAEAQAAVKKLQTQPDDAAAATALSHWLWFHDGRISESLQWLAKGEDGTWRKLAERDLKSPADAEEQLALADAWYDLAQSLPARIQHDWVCERAWEWYNRALGGVAGLHKVKAEKRAEELKAVGEKLAQSLPKTDRPRLPVNRAALKPGLVAKYFAGRNFDKPLFERVDSSVGLSIAEAPDSGISPTDFSIRWSGYLLPPKAGKYTIFVRSDDGARLSIDRRVVTEYWPQAAAQVNGAVRLCTVDLTGEPIPFELEYYQADGPKQLFVAWLSVQAGVSQQLISEEHFLHDQRDEPKNPKTIAPKPSPSIDLAAALRATGAPGLIGHVQCGGRDFDAYVQWRPGPPMDAKSLTDMCGEKGLAGSYSLTFVGILAIDHDANIKFTLKGTPPSGEIHLADENGDVAVCGGKNPLSTVVEKKYDGGTYQFIWTLTAAELNDNPSLDIIDTTANRPVFLLATPLARYALQFSASKTVPIRTTPPQRPSGDALAKPPTAPSGDTASKPPTAPPGGHTEPVIEKNWTVLFRSANPAIWNSETNKSPTDFAFKVANAPENTQWLKIAMPAQKDKAAIIPMQKTKLLEKNDAERYCWNGKGNKMWDANHLGVFSKEWNSRQTGAIDITGDPARGFRGWGFGNKYMINRGQGFAWEGEEVTDDVFEISVKAEDLTDAEKKFLLK